MEKIKKLLFVIKYILLDFLGSLYGTLFPSEVPKGLWLVSERGFDARDNGFWMFEYLTREHPEMPVFYVITKDSCDYQKVSRLGKTVERGSFRHYVYLMHAEALLSSHDCGCTPDLVLYHHMAKRGLFRPKGVVAFLQHGISDKIIPWYFRSEFQPDIFVLAAEDEKQNIAQNHNQPESVLKLTGFPRFDQLMDFQAEKMVLLMPTWRQFLQNVSQEEFQQSEYCLQYTKLLQDEKLKDLLEQTGYRAVFYPHVEMQKYLQPQENGRIRIASMKTDDVQDLLKRCEILITDYSSVYFDVAYMNKPIIFFQFDKNRYEGEHYQECVIPHSRFGAVLHTTEEVILELEHHLLNNSHDEKRENRRNDFYAYHDQKNCERVFGAVSQEVDRKKNNQHPVTG